MFLSHHLPPTQTVFIALGKEATRCLKPFSVGLRRQVVGKEHQAFNETALLQQRVESIRGKVSKKLVAFSVINGLVCYKKICPWKGEASILLQKDLAVMVLELDTWPPTPCDWCSAGNLFQIFAAERVPSTKCLTHVRWCSPMEKGKRYRPWQDSNLQSPDQYEFTA